MKIGIYKITNIKNGKCYIGLSKDIESRFKQHIRGSANYYSSKKLYYAIQDWGVENFKFTVLEECLQKDLGARENYYIKKFNSFLNGYNSSWGGEGAKFQVIKDKFNLNLSPMINYRNSFLNDVLIINYNEYLENSRGDNYNGHINYLDEKLQKLNEKKSTERRKRKILQLINSENIFIQNHNNFEKKYKESILKYKKIIESINISNHAAKIIIENAFLKTPHYINDYTINTLSVNRRRFQKDNVKYIEITLENMEDILVINHKKIKTLHSKWIVNWPDIKSITFDIYNINYVEININSFSKSNISGVKTVSERKRIDKNQMLINMKLSDFILIKSKILEIAGI